MKILQSKQKGISLVELMVGLFVGTLLLAGLIQIVINSGQSYRLQSSVSSMQESGQFAVEHLLRDMRNTAFVGCLPDPNLIASQLNGSSSFLTFDTGIEGTEDEDGSGSALSGTDTITMRGASNVLGGRSLQAPLPSVVSDPIVIGPNSGVQANDILLISDCEAGDVFQVTSIDGNGTVGHTVAGGSPGNSSADLSKVYSEAAFAYVPYTRMYDVRNGTNGAPALFITDNSGSQELVPGVENMIIFYGEDTTGNGIANRYVRANSVTDMDNVVSIRVSLLLRSDTDNLAPDPVQYTFNQQTVTPTDHRLRRVYTSTVMLRNRGS